MTRKEFIKLCAILGVSTLLADEQSKTTKKMPALFLSHGSPMNIIRDNAYTDALKNITKTFAKPKAIVVISAHWYEDRTYISNSKKQETIYDFYRFPKELYEIKYEPKGSSELAQKVKTLLRDDSFLVDRGLDHGAWSMLHHMYPQQDIPTFQISINKNLDYEEYFEIGSMLSILREQGILVIGSGGVTHNLRLVKRSSNSVENDPWAVEFDNFVAKSFEAKELKNLISAPFHDAFTLAHPFDDHYIPLLYVAGMVQKDDKIESFYKGIEKGNLSMRCIKIG